MPRAVPPQDNFAGADIEWAKQTNPEFARHPSGVDSGRFTLNVTHKG